MWIYSEFQMIQCRGEKCLYEVIFDSTRLLVSCPIFSLLLNSPGPGPGFLITLKFLAEVHTSNI